MSAVEKKLHLDKFSFETKVRGDKKIIHLRGEIDEDTSFEDVKKVGGPFVFNFKELDNINSCGIRTWVNFLKELGNIKFAYEECPPLVVRQMNMVPSFKGGATVISVYVPYVCDACETEKLVLISGEKLADPSSIPESFTCEKCKKGEMELDGHPDQYFAFLR